MTEIVRAPDAGFCFGVKNAIDKARKETEKPGGQIFTHGMLIHNNRVVRDLEELGIGMVEDLEEAPAGSRIIVRSHGEPRSFYEKAEELGLTLIDATCPFVAHIHDLVRSADEEGMDIVIAGDPSHPEVQGINGWCRDRAVILSDTGDAERYIDKIYTENTAEEAAGILKNTLVVSQTTMRAEIFSGIISVIDKDGSMKIRNTICSATADRQEGCAKTAGEVDAMIVIGDRVSSNTKKLYEIAEKHCAHVFFVENLSDLSLKDLKKYNRIGVAAGASTPDYAIKEVISRMSEKFTDEGLTMDDFMDEIEKSLRLPKGGELVTGKVHQVTDKEIIVNLGCKKDGIIPLNEISLEGDQKLTDLFSEGDEIQAKVLKTDDGDGTILLSRKKLEVSAHWEEINKAYESGDVIDVEVIRQVNGGVIALYKDVSGFIPLSQLSDRFVEDSSEFLGQTLTVKVSRVDQRRGRAVFSHKEYLREERRKALEKIWENIEVGDIVEGTVMRFTDYGAFVDIGGIDGLLHISEISWGKLRHPKEVLEIGQRISVKVLSMNEEKGKISLGLKQTVPEPWSVIDENYTIGQIVKGKVVQIKEYGCFVELEPGLDGLVHISEIKNERVADINEEISIGQIVDVKILEIDKDRKRIALSIKEALKEMPFIEETEEPEEPEEAGEDEAAEAAEPEEAGEVTADGDEGAAEEAETEAAGEAEEAGETETEAAGETGEAESGEAEEAGPEEAE